MGSLIQCDVKGLEVVCAAFRYQDEVLMQELWDREDIHSNNQNTFNLPSRLIAKIFKFRLIYGGSAYAFAVDPAFKEVGYNEKRWQEVIDAYYDKYRGIRRGHTKDIQEVVRTGKLITQTGRELRFQKYKGEYKDTQIKNYPIQSTGADVMAIGRVSAFNRISKMGFGDKCLFINTIHDSLILDTNLEMCDNISIVNTLKQTFLDVPLNFKKLFGVEFNCPMEVEVQMGKNWKEMEVV